MGDSAGPRQEVVEIGVASSARGAGSANGDLHLVHPRPRGALLVVLDALGHGPLAAASAQRAVDTFAAAAHLSLPESIKRCHVALKGRRGVVASIAVIDAVAGTLTWAGIGNVEAMLIRAGSGDPSTRSGLVTLGGIIGSDLPEVRPQQLPLAPGDHLVFATDGVRREFVDAPAPQADVLASATQLLARYGKGTDDALVLVARYLGPPDDGR